jgi:predicted ATP-grasp superfamily ATP-dependent carboligase
VLLAGGDDRSMLAAGRSLARHGIPFVALGVERWGMVGTSRYVRRHAVGGAPDPTREPRAYARCVREHARRHGVELIVPLTDRILLACDRHRDLLAAQATLGMPPSAAVRNVLDKRLNLETARSLGVPCPAQFELESMKQVPELVDRLRFPLILKDPGPSATDDRPGFGFAWLVARDRGELERHLRDRCPPGAYPIVQEFVEGSIHSLCCFAATGEIVAAHAYRRLRRARGMSSYRVLTDVRPDLLEYASRLLGALAWEGAAHVSFFVRDGDGAPLYTETNGRFWSPLEASVAVGFDFPLWTYRYFTTGELPDAPPAAHGVGRRSRWHYGELEALVQFMVGREEPRRPGQGRIGAVIDYGLGFSPRVHADVFQADDPLPEVMEHVLNGKRVLRAFSRGLVRRLIRRIAGPEGLERVRRLRDRRAGSTG